MFKTILPWLTAFITLLGWWLFFSQTKSLWWVLIVSILLIVWTARRIAGRLFWQYKLSWLNIIFIYLAQSLFLLLLKSNNLRFGLAFWLALLWGFIWLFWQQYFRKVHIALLQAVYLSFNKFWYYLNFWFLASGIYALLAFINLPLLLAFSIILLVGFSLSLELLLRERVFSWRLLLLWSWLFLQITAAISLLPISFYLAGALLTLWYFFLDEAWLESGQKWHWHTSLLLVANLLILIITFLYI